jgi:hypothetical protein
MDKLHTQPPAYDIQVAQSQSGLIPELTKLEYFSIQILPAMLQIAAKMGKLSNRGTPITPQQAAIEAAQDLIKELQKISNHEKNHL